MMLSIGQHRKIHVITNCQVLYFLFQSYQKYYNKRCSIHSSFYIFQICVLECVIVGFLYGLYIWVLEYKLQCCMFKCVLILMRD